MFITIFLTKKQTTKIRNAFAGNILTYIKLSKARISKKIQSGLSFFSWLDNLDKKALINVAIPLARDDLPELLSNLASNEINNSEKKVEKEPSEQEKDLLCLFWMKIWMILLKS